MASWSAWRQEDVADLPRTGPVTPHCAASSSSSALDVSRSSCSRRMATSRRGRRARWRRAGPHCAAASSTARVKSPTSVQAALRIADRARDSTAFTSEGHQVGRKGLFGARTLVARTRPSTRMVFCSITGMVQNSLAAHAVELAQPQHDHLLPLLRDMHRRHGRLAPRPGQPPRPSRQWTRRRFAPHPTRCRSTRRTGPPRTEPRRRSNARSPATVVFAPVGAPGGARTGPGVRQPSPWHGTMKPPAFARRRMPACVPFAAHFYTPVLGGARAHRCPLRRYAPRRPRAQPRRPPLRFS